MASFLGDRFNDAFVYSSNLHREQLWKGTSVPYVSHLMSVCALVLEHGGNEDEAIAALLPDAVEDQGGSARLVEIRERFGDVVADIMSGCSDTDEIPKPPWRTRKERYIGELAGHPLNVMLVSLADKLHNTRATLADYRAIGPEVWMRFNADAADQLWYCEALAVVFREHLPGTLAEEFERVCANCWRATTPVVCRIELDHLRPARTRTP